MMLRDLSEAVGISASHLHPYLVSLRASGLVEQTERGLYTLGPFALELGSAGCAARTPIARRSAASLRWSRSCS
jgi:DNA-binding IclR family transcriptional regulator